MKHHDAEQKNRYSSGLEDNLKKALTELLILFLFGEEEHYIGELSPLLEKRSHGVLSIVFPYAAIYRITQSGYLTETKKKTAPDGRLRQYYAITETGRAYLQKLLETYQAFFQGVNDILLRGNAMRRTDLSLYEKRLRKSVSGFRLRSKVQAAFRRSLSPLLEETPCPSYDALLRAFGPPEHMAQTLLQTMTTHPHPRSGKLKWILAVSIPLLLIFGCFGALSFRDRPEQNFTLSDASAYSEKVLLQDYVFCQDRTFCDCDVEWDQPKEYPSYLLLLQNENETSTKITVRYSQRQPPHTFDVPPESTRAFLVDDSQPGAHVISFSSSNGSLAGTVRVLLSNA